MTQPLGIPGDFSAILSLLTPDNYTLFQAIYTYLENHAAATKRELSAYISGLEVDMRADLEADESLVTDDAALASLRSLGLILCSDNRHVGLTPLGYGFIQTMRQQQ